MRSYKDNNSKKVNTSHSKVGRHKAVVILLSLVLVFSLAGQAAAAKNIFKTGNGALEIYEGNPYASESFEAVNMLPGDGTKYDDEGADSKAKYYCVRVYHSGAVTLNFKTTVTSKENMSPLEDNLCLEVSTLADASDLKSKQTKLCEGTFAALDNARNGNVYSITLAASSAGYTDTVFRINPYLPTSTGNDCQNKTLTADFEWYVDISSGGSGPITPTDPSNPTDPTDPSNPENPNAPDNPSGDDNSKTSDDDDKPSDSDKNDKQDKDKNDKDKSEGSLTKPPKTGDSLSISLWALTGISSLLLLFVLVKRRKEDAEDDK